MHICIEHRPHPNRETQAIMCKSQTGLSFLTTVLNAHLPSPNPLWEHMHEVPMFLKRVRARAGSISDNSQKQQSGPQFTHHRPRHTIRIKPVPNANMPPGCSLRESQQFTSYWNASIFQ